MSADFWAGYISGAVGIVVGNPLDLIKTRLQAGDHAITQPTSPRSLRNTFDRAGTLVRGASAPILGYGALNALLFITYNRTLAILTNSPGSYPITTPTYAQIYLAGLLGGIATFVVSAPTELIKVRAQVANASTNAPTSSLAIVRQIFAREGLRGLYRGGAVTAVRDSVGYGFYFCAYDASKQIFGGTRNYGGRGEGESLSAWKILMCGGIAGCVSWASIFPLDVVKTRVQSEAIGTPAISGAAASSQHSGGLVSSPAEREPLLGQQRASDANKRTSSTTPPATSTSALSRRGPTSPSTLAITLATYREGGLGIFFRGLGVCSVRAFVVNAVQWAVYEWVMGLLLHGEKTRATVDV